MFRRPLEWACHIIAACHIISQREPLAALPWSLWITPLIEGGEASLKFKWVSDDSTSIQEFEDRRIFTLAGTLDQLID